MGSDAQNDTESPPLEVFKTQLDKPWEPWSRQSYCDQGVKLDDLQRSISN